MRSRRGTRSAATPPTFSLIPSTPSTTPSTLTTPTSTENIRIYLAIAISARVNIVYKQITKIVKDFQAINY